MLDWKYISGNFRDETSANSLKLAFRCRLIGRRSNSVFRCWAPRCRDASRDWCKRESRSPRMEMVDVGVAAAVAMAMAADMRLPRRIVISFDTRPDGGSTAIHISLQLYHYTCSAASLNSLSSAIGASGIEIMTIRWHAKPDRLFSIFSIMRAASFTARTNCPEYRTLNLAHVRKRLDDLLRISHSTWIASMDNKTPNRISLRNGDEPRKIPGILAFSWESESINSFVFRHANRSVEVFSVLYHSGTWFGGDVYQFVAECQCIHNVLDGRTENLFPECNSFIRNGWLNNRMDHKYPFQSVFLSSDCRFDQVNRSENAVH